MLKAPSYKLTIPRAVGHVRREKLLAKLSERHRRAALTWVVGLPGAGKTALVAGWANDAGSSCVWYRLDEGDADVARLFDALTTALQDRVRLPVWSPDHQADLVDFARHFFSALTEGTKKEPLTIVLDDCHRIADESPLFTVLELLHEVAGDNLRVVAISRRGPPPALARGTVGGWLAVLDDLRLEAREAKQLAQTVRGAKLDARELEAIEQADGWLAPVLAVAHGSGSAMTNSHADWQIHVGDFLAAELLASVPKGHKDQLRRLAELPEIPQHLPNTKWLPPEIVRLLSTLSAQRYFVDITGQSTWRLHDLLRDALLQQNAQADSPEVRSEVRRELAAWVSEAMPEAAMQLRVAARDQAGALALLAIHGERWLASGLHRSLLAWLRDLPEPENPGDRATLTLFRAQALLPLEPEGARPLFAAARHASVAAGAADRAYAAWCGEVASYVVQWGAVQGLADLVDDLEALEKQLGPPIADMAFRTSADALTALMYGRAEDQRIAKYAEATARAVAHAPDKGARIGAAAQLLIYRLWWAGDFAAGRALYDAFDTEVDEDESLPALPRLLWWSNAAIVDWQCGEPSACYAKVERGLQLADASGVHVRDFFLLTQGIFCALSQEDWPRAEGYLKKLARTERTHQRLDVMVHHFFRSWHSLSRGDPAGALAHAEAAWPMAEAMGSMFHKVIVLSALAPARVHTGDLPGAEAAYREQLALAKAARNPTFSFIAFCSAAEIALARGDEKELAKQVERMLLVKKLGGFHTGCGWRTPMMRDVLAFALKKEIWPDIARQWIREKRISPPKDAPSGWPMPVRILASEGLVVELDDPESKEETGGKAARRLRELLAVLVAERNGALQTDLIDWLWADADGDRGAASLKVAIFRLRQWLGAESVLVADGRVRLNPERVECDIWRNGVGSNTEKILHGFDLPPVLALRRRH